MRKRLRSGVLHPAEIAYLPSGCELCWWASSRIRGLWVKRGAKAGSDWRGGAASEPSPTAGACHSASQSTNLPSICLFCACQPSPATPHRAQSWHLSPAPKSVLETRAHSSCPPLFCVPIPGMRGSPGPQKRSGLLTG